MIRAFYSQFIGMKCTKLSTVFFFFFLFGPLSGVDFFSDHKKNEWIMKNEDDTLY